jgi:acyl dehydratase
VGGECRPLGRRDVIETGTRLGPSDWVEVGQERIDEFARATDDFQSIHVDPEAAAAGPFGTTVAHGFLTLSLLVPMLYEVMPPHDGVTVNYGVNRVRFPAPLPSGSRIRATFETLAVEDGRVTLAATVEREGGDKPVCVAELVLLLVSSTGGSQE